MPAAPGRDKKGTFIRWGNQTKYYYHDKKSKAAAWAKATAQGAAIKHAGYKGNEMKYNCECIKCGHVIKTNKHCKDLKCSKCGGQMRRKERPGPGRLQRITANFIPGQVRHDQMEGRDFLVAPMVMIVEGVHNGSEGPVYYPKNELAKTPAMWNYKPVVVYHPMKNGEGCSACDPIILSNRKVGVIMNTEFTETEHGPGLKAEAWMEADRMNVVDERITEAVEKGTMMELSTGLFFDSDRTPGKWQEEEFIATVSNYRPDHLALLPDLKGACSIEDGAGLFRLNARQDAIKIASNEMSHGNVRSLLNSWLQNKNTNDEAYEMYVEDVYDAFFVFMKNGKLFKGDYTVTNETIEVKSAFEEVIRVTEYRTKDGGRFVGNENDNSNRKELAMDKKKIVDALIASNANSWGEDDRETLTAMDEAVLVKMQASEKLAADKAVENAVEKYRKEEADKKAAAEAEAQTNANVNTDAEQKPKTVKEYIDGAPSEIRPAMQNMMTSYDLMKQALVKRLTDNEKCPFTENELKAKDVGELKQLVALASSGSPEEEEVPLDYTGQGLEPAANVNEAPLVMPAVVSANAVKKS